MIATTSDEDLRALREALRGTLGSARSGETTQADSLGWRRTWPALAELGVTSFCVPEEQGGFGFQLDAAVSAAFELGAALNGSPFAGLTASVHAIAQQAGDLNADLLAGALAGERIVGFGRLAKARPIAPLVDGGVEADALLLAASEGEDLQLFTDPAAWRAVAARVEFDVTRTAAVVTVLGDPALRFAADPLTESIYGLLLAADAVGCVQHMLERTVVYAAQRETFGKPIGGVQAVQHRLVDHTVRARGMELTTLEAARLLSTGAPGAERMAAIAMVGVSSSATHIIHDLLQLTGAIGFTWEYGLHLHTRRVHHDAALASNPRAAIRALSLLEGWADVR